MYLALDEKLISCNLVSMAAYQMSKKEDKKKKAFLTPNKTYTTLECKCFKKGKK